MAAVGGAGRPIVVVAPDQLASVAGLFGPDAQVISGIEVIMSTGLDAGEVFVLSTAAVECYEQRTGVLSVVEPSVLGATVSYSAYFSVLPVLAEGIAAVAVTGAAPPVVPPALEGRWSHGVGPPVITEDSLPGDYYLDTATGDVYLLGGL